MGRPYLRNEQILGRAEGEIKMYDGVGLQTPKGSGTSGHVQRNLAVTPRKEKQREQTEPLIRKVNKEILEHEKKRKIEVECMELSDTLESYDYTQQEIDAEVNAYRKRRLADYEKSRKQQEQDESRI